MCVRHVGGEKQGDVNEAATGKKYCDSPEKIFEVVNLVSHGKCISLLSRTRLYKEPESESLRFITVDDQLYSIDGREG